MTNDPRCIYCGTARPAAEARCPNCGRRWADQTIAEAIAPPPSAPRENVPETVESGPEPVAVPVVRRRRGWVFPVAITVIAVIIYAVVFVVLLETTGDDDDPPPAASSSTTSPEPTPTAASQAPEPTTTLPDPDPTTTPAPAPTTTTEPPPPPIPAVGNPIAIEDLTLGAFALGPLEFRDTDTNALGRMVATFGQPDEVWPIGEAEGLCPTEEGRAARFGWLTLLLADEAGSEALVGYRLEEPESGAAGHPTAGLRTISGAAIGISVGDWNGIYNTSIVTTEEIDGVGHLLLLRSSDRKTLLWGPLSEDDPPTTRGIYSPRPCDGGPLSRGGG